MEKPSMTAEQQACEEHSHRYTTQQLNRRYVVSLPITMEPNYIGTSGLPAEWRTHASECKLEHDPELKIQYHNFIRKYKELDHRDPVNSQEGRKHYFLQNHPVFKETSSTTRTQIAFGGGAKPSNGTQQHNWWVLPRDRFFHCTDMYTWSTKQMEDICRRQSRHHSKRNIFSNM